MQDRVNSRFQKLLSQEDHLNQKQIKEEEWFTSGHPIVHVCKATTISYSMPNWLGGCFRVFYILTSL
jgi:hypothetical protein